MFNQNFDSGWGVSHGVVEQYNKMLSVRFDKAVKIRIRLTFLPLSFVLGLLISVLSLFGAAVYVLRGRKPCRP